MIKIVTVKFKEGGKNYYFAPGNDKYEKGMGVIVETAKGLEYATVVAPEGEVDESRIVSPLKPVVRIATAKDEEQVKRNRERRGEALELAQKKIEERGLEMKLVDCEFAFDGSKVVFYFTAESRVDFRELIKDLSSAFRSRIELRQISIREEIKMTGGLAPCGRECCCINCMKEPLKVSVKMAKNQGLSLNPGKISGLCGRLMCCLSYENDYYSEVCKQVPKVGSEIDTPDGRGLVVNVNMLKMTVKVKIEENDSVTYHDFTVEEIKSGKRAPKEAEEKSNAELILEKLSGGEDGGTSPSEHGERQERREGNGQEGHGKHRGRDRGHGKNKDENRENTPRREKKEGDRREKSAAEGGGERRENNGGKNKPKGNREGQPGQEKNDRNAQKNKKGGVNAQGGQNGQNRRGGNGNQNKPNKQGDKGNDSGNRDERGRDENNAQGGQRSGRRHRHRHGKGGGANNGGKVEPATDGSQNKV